MTIKLPRGNEGCATPLLFIIAILVVGLAVLGLATCRRGMLPPEANTPAMGGGGPAAANAMNSGITGRPAE